ncbi:MAG TPA: S1 RNA-binding domain-containing protein, partial [Candidatus Diapherotrites archaeon]|nr:S1 RNA-binding domain-containing protein [Candidatus Diapherotrites archaeon]
RFVRRPLDVVQVGDIVKVRVLDVDLDRNRISLSMKGISQA